MAEYVRFHLDGLHAHHSTEDELIWPVLHERATLSDALISRMEEQHAGVHDALETHGASWRHGAPHRPRAGRESLATALDTVVDRLPTHSPRRSATSYR